MEQCERCATLEAALAKAEGEATELRKQNDYWTGVVRGHANDRDAMLETRDDAETELATLRTALAAAEGERDEKQDMIEDVLTHLPLEDAPCGTGVVEHAEVWARERDEARDARDTARAKLKEAEIRVRQLELGYDELNGIAGKLRAKLKEAETDLAEVRVSRQAEHDLRCRLAGENEDLRKKLKEADRLLCCVRNVNIEPCGPMVEIVADIRTYLASLGEGGWDAKGHDFRQGDDDGGPGPCSKCGEMPDEPFDVCTPRAQGLTPMQVEAAFYEGVRVTAYRALEPDTKRFTDREWDKSQAKKLLTSLPPPAQAFSDIDYSRDGRILMTVQRFCAADWDMPEDFEDAIRRLDAEWDRRHSVEEIRGAWKRAWEDVPQGPVFATLREQLTKPRPAGEEGEES